MKHFGDITKIKGSGVPIVDIVCGGSPCQDLSIAGRREGLSGERSGLFMEQIRIIKEMREHDKSNRGADVDIRFLRPRFMVWENVPGAFSSNGGEDFRAVLEETAKIADETAVIPKLEGGQRWTPSGCILGDGWSIAWRVHDAQFWGVPQRRKRIALVADFGGPTAPEILFERKGLYGDSETCGKEGKGIAGVTENGTTEAISFLERAGCDGGAREYLSNMNEQQPCPPSTTNQSLECLKDDRGGQEPYTASKASFFLRSHNDGVADVLVATDYKDPPITCYGIDRASFNQGQNALYDFSVEEEKAQTIVARGPGGVLAKQLERYVQEITKE